MKIILTIPKKKIEDFLRDWHYVSQDLRKECIVNYAMVINGTKVEIEVMNDTAAPVFATLIFGEKGFLTKMGWKNPKFDEVTA